MNQFQLHILGLTKTKIRGVDISRVSLIWGRSPCKFISCNASYSSSGGVIMIWNPDMFHCSSSFQGNRWILLHGQIIPSQWEFSVAVLYRGHIIGDRDIIYNKVMNARQGLSSPLLIMGDFNEDLNIDERRGQSRKILSMRRFRGWVESLNLIDIPLNGRKFTWRRGNSQSKLDRFLFTSDCLVKYPEMRASGKLTEISDHVAIFLALNAIQNWGPKPFKSLDVWLTNSSFK